MNTTGNYNGGSDTSFTLMNIMTILFRRKWVLLLFGATVIIAVTAVAFLSPPVFRASSKLIIEREIDSEKALLFRMNLPTEYEKHDRLNSEIEIIKSYPVAVRTVRSLELWDAASYAQARPERKQELLAEATKRFQKNLDVQKVKMSNVIEISYEAADAEEAAVVVNKVIETYISYRSEIYDESDTYKFFEEQMRIADEKIRTLEAQQAQYKEDKKLLSPESQRDILLTRMSDYERALTEVRRKRIGQEARLQVIKSQLHSGRGVNIPSTDISNSLSREKHIAKLRGELLDLELQREQLLQKFTPEYEEVVNVAKRIEATQEKITNEITEIINMEETAISALIAEEAALRENIAEVSELVQSFAIQEYEYAQLSRGIDDNREVYSMLLKQREEARLSLAKLQNGVLIKIISPAVIPLDPIKPKKKLAVFCAFFFAVVGGLFLVLCVEYFSRSFTNLSEVKKITEYTVLGSVREIEGEKFKALDVAELGIAESKPSTSTHR